MNAKALMLIFLAMGLTGCTYQQARQPFVWVRGQIWPEEVAAKATATDSKVHIWCYRTLAKPDCYPTPQPGEEARLIGVYPVSDTPRTEEEYRKKVGESQGATVTTTEVAPPVAQQTTPQPTAKTAPQPLKP